MLDRLHAEITGILNRADVRDAWAKQGAVPMLMSREEFGRYLRDDIDKWAKVVEVAGIKAQ